jgi:hypothetical protein
MKMHDDLRARLRRGAEVPVGSPELDRIERRAAVRRTRRVAGTVVASALVAAAVIAPLVALTAVGGNDPVVPPGDGESATASPEQTVVPSADPTQNVLGRGECAFDNNGVQIGLALTSEATVPDPVEVCQAFWRSGDVRDLGSVAVWVSIPEGAEAVAHDADLPLVACAGPGTFKVVVSDDDGACAAEGLWPVPPEAEETARRWVAAHDAFAARAFPETDGSCTSGSDAVRIVREELDAQGFTGWRVVDSFERDDAQRPCAAYGSDFAKMQVTIVNDTVS